MDMLNKTEKMGVLLEAFDKIFPGTPDDLIQNFLASCNYAREMNTKLPKATLKEIFCETQNTSHLVKEVILLENRLKSQAAELETYKTIFKDEMPRKDSIETNLIKKVDCNIEAMIALGQQRKEVNKWVDRKNLLETVAKDFVTDMKTALQDSKKCLTEFNNRTEEISKVLENSEEVLVETQKKIAYLQNLKFNNEYKMQNAVFDYKFLEEKFKLEMMRKREREEHQCLHKCDYEIIPFRIEDCKPEVDDLVLSMIKKNLQPLNKIFNPGYVEEVPEPKFKQPRGCHCIMHLIGGYNHNYVVTDSENKEQSEEGKSMIGTEATSTTSNEEHVEEEMTVTSSETCIIDIFQDNYGFTNPENMDQVDGNNIEVNKNEATSTTSNEGHVEEEIPEMTVTSSESCIINIFQDNYGVTDPENMYQVDDNNIEVNTNEAISIEASKEEQVEENIPEMPNMVTSMETYNLEIRQDRSADTNTENMDHVEGDNNIEVNTYEATSPPSKKEQLKLDIPEMPNMSRVLEFVQLYLASIKSKSWNKVESSNSMETRVEALEVISENVAKNTDDPHILAIMRVIDDMVFPRSKVHPEIILETELSLPLKKRKLTENCFLEPNFACISKDFISATDITEISLNKIQNQELDA